MTCRTVLSFQSTVLCEMLDTGGKSLPLPGCSLETAQRFLNFIYNGNAAAITGLVDLPDVLRLCHKFDMRGALKLHDVALASMVSGNGESPDLWVWLIGTHFLTCNSRMV